MNKYTYKGSMISHSGLFDILAILMKKTVMK